MSGRKSLSKKIRFEVFKRDSFKCQYCGRTSPDVILEADHIKPVSEGGTDDITNLITACFDCNRGKSNILLDDKSVIEKQRKQLEEINERRQQLKMMMEWREELVAIDQEKINILKNHWEGSTGYTITDTGIKEMKKWIKKFDINLLLDCMEISVNQYLRQDESGKNTVESVEKAFDMTPRIAANKSKGDDESYMRDLFYIRGILNNRLSYVDPVIAIEYLKLAHIEADITIDSLKDYAKRVVSWTDFKRGMEELFEDENVEY